MLAKKVESFFSESAAIPLKTLVPLTVESKNQILVKVYALIWTPEIWPPLYSGHFENNRLFDISSTLK